MQVLKKYYSGRLNFLLSICLQSGFFPAFVIENRHALSLEFSLFGGSCHELGQSAAFIALTSIPLAGRTFLQ